MPQYEYKCSKHGEILLYKPFSESGREEFCELCQDKLQRVYSVQLKKEFFAYDDPQYKCTISSAKEERAMMKKNKHVYFDETPAAQNPRWKEVKRKARKKPMWSTPAGTTRMDRD